VAVAAPSDVRLDLVVQRVARPRVIAELLERRDGAADAGASRGMRGQQLAPARRFWIDEVLDDQHAQELHVRERVGAQVETPMICCDLGTTRHDTDERRGGRIEEQRRGDQHGHPPSPR
jgi:hypothetical protein